MLVRLVFTWFHVVFGWFHLALSEPLSGVQRVDIVP